MPRFPIAEPDVAALAALVADGLEQAAEDFPTPPVPATELRTKLDTYTRTRVCPCKLGIHSQSDGYELDLVISQTNSVFWTNHLTKCMSLGQMDIRKVTFRGHRSAAGTARPRQTGVSQLRPQALPV